MAWTHRWTNVISSQTRQEWPSHYQHEITFRNSCEFHGVIHLEPLTVIDDDRVGKTGSYRIGAPDLLVKVLSEQRLGRGHLLPEITTCGLEKHTEKSIPRTNNLTPAPSRANVRQPPAQPARARCTVPPAPRRKLS